MRINRYLVLIFLSIFNNDLTSQQAHYGKINEGVYYYLQFDFTSAEDVLTDYISTTTHSDSISLAKFHLAHTKLWQFEFDEAGILADEINKNTQSISMEIRDRISLIYPIIKAHKREFRPALLELKSVLLNYKENNGIEHPEWYIWKPYLAFLYHFSQSDFEESAKLYDLYVEEFERNFPEGVNMKWALQVLQAMLYYYQDDKNLSIDILKSIESKCKESEYCTKYLLSYIYRCLSYFSLAGNDPDLAWTYAQYGMKYSNSPYTLAKNKEMFSLVHTYNEKYSLGEKYHQHALKLFSNFHIQEETINCIENYASSLKPKGRYEKIIELGKAIDNLPVKKYSSSYGGNSYIPGILYEYYLNRKEYDKSLLYLNKSIVNTFQSIKTLSGWEMPPIKKLPIHVNAAKMYTEKARLSHKVHLETKDNELLRRALLFSMQADSIYNLINKKIVNTQTTKDNLSGQYINYTYFTNIAISNYIQCPTLENTKALFHFISRTQDVDLALSLLMDKFESQNNAYKELSLLKDSIRQENKTRNLSYESTYVQDLLNKIEIRQKQVISKQQNEIDNYPYNTKTDRRHVIYHYTKDKFITIYLNDTISMCFIDNLQHNIDSLVSRYLYSISDPTINIDTLSQNILNEYLINPLIPLDSEAPCTITASGSLASLPIELLWYTSLKELPVLSYAYNYKQIKNNKATEYSNTISIIKPNFQTDASLDFSELKFGEREAELISELFDATTLFGTSATLSNFKLALNESQIVHLVTHAYQDRSENNQSYVSLYDNDRDKIKKYKMSDLANISGSADLVVLSGCQTGTGKHEAGLGIQSFAKLFISKGNKAVLSSLWKVNDRSTSMIISYFYKNLTYGLPKDVALQKAKKQYLTIVDPEYKDPYYWAGLVLSGDTSTMQLVKTNRKLKNIAMLSCIIILLYVFNRVIRS